MIDQKTLSAGQFFLHLGWMCSIPLISIAHFHEPLYLYARDGVTCPSQGHVLIARGNVEIKQGDLQIKADEMHLCFAELNQGAAGQQSTPLPLPMGRVDYNKLVSISAHGHVTIQTAGNTLSADRATYTLSSGEMAAKGKNIVLASEKWTLYAHDSLTYGVRSGLLHALGRVRLIKGSQGLETDQIQAQLTPGSHAILDHKLQWPSQAQEKQKKIEFQWVRSPSTIRIWDTQKHYVTQSDTAVFYPKEQKIHLCGHVQIQYQKRYLTGHRAIFDFNHHTIVIPPGPEKLSALIPAPSSTRKK